MRKKIKKAENIYNKNTGKKTETKRDRTNL